MSLSPIEKAYRKSSECPSCHHLGLRFIGEEKKEAGSPPVLRHYSICFQCGNYWYYDEKMEKAKMYMGLFLNQPMHIENAKQLNFKPIFVKIEIER